MIKQLAHVNIGAYDLDAALHFYCDVLGLDRTFDFFKDGELFGFYLGSGNTTFIEIFIQEPGTAQGESLQKHFCLEVEDIDGFIARVRSKGWPIGEKSLGSDHSWQVWLEDPSGIGIEVMQYTPESSELTGAPALVDW
jgi:glyoxylase I family protein